MSLKKHVLNVITREAAGSGPSRRDRRSGMIPGVVYGRGVDTRSLLVKATDLRLLQKAEAHLVELKFDDGAAETVLIKDMQHNRLAGGIIHIDLMAVRMDEKLTTEVLVHIHGTPIGLSQGGTFEQNLYAIEVSCLPNDLPESIDIDVSGMNLNDTIHVGDVVMPAGVEVVGDHNVVVAHVFLPDVREEEAESEAEAAKPESVEKAKEDK